MPPHRLAVPSTTSCFAFHSKHLRHRCSAQRSASTNTTAIEQALLPSFSSPGPSQQPAIWRGKDPMTRGSEASTGAMEWQTSTYSFNKQAIKALPTAAINVQKLIEAYVTLKHVGDRSGIEPRAIRTALAARRKSADKVYVSSPRIKDFGTYILLTAYVFDGGDDPSIAAAKKLRERRSGDKASSGGRDGAAVRKPETDLDIMLHPEQQAGLQSLISRIYAKPVQLNLIKLAKQHLDADILAAFVSQRLRDRSQTSRRVTRDATWKAPLPDARAISMIQQTKQLKLVNGGKKISWQDLKMKSLAPTSTSSIVEELALGQVSSVQVEAAGRLTRRLTANRSNRKMARRGTTSKLPSPILLGLRKKHTQYAFRGGKRRVGQYGIRVHLGHT